MRAKSVALLALFLGAAAAAVLLFWKPPVSASAQQTPASVTQTEVSLADKVRLLSDSLSFLDRALRESQLDSSESSSDLARLHQDLWSRYTWARTRLSASVDSASAPAPVPSAAPNTNVGLGKMLGGLATYLWIVAGVSTLLFGGLVWWLFLRRSEKPTHRPLTDPTLTRNDRNFRLPVTTPGVRTRPQPLAEPSGSQDLPPRPAPPSFTSTRPAMTDPAVSPAPPPRTGRYAWENQIPEPVASTSSAPAEPTVVQDYVVSMAKRGRTPAEIARRLRIPQDQVDLILKLRRPV